MNAQNIVNSLYEHYGSDAEVGQATGVAQSTINRLRRGVTSPSWKTYQALLLQLKLIEEQAA